jgi:hypothetical protein
MTHHGFSKAFSLFGLVYWFIKKGDETIVLPQDYATHVDANGRLRPLIQFAQAAKTLDLVTVVVRDRMTSATHQEHWRGNVDVSFEVPVTYQYGVSLAGIKPESFSLLPGSKTFRVEIPKPRRLSTEVFTEKAEKEKIEVGWLRLRSRAGNFLLHQAYKNVRAEAERRVLPPAKRQEIERDNLQQVKKLLQHLAEQFGGPGAKVDVSYSP